MLRQFTLHTSAMQCCSEGAFTPDANEAIRANDFTGDKREYGEGG